MGTVRIKRIYAPPEPEDGYRVLVDRLWPRGVSKKAANLNLWLKEIAPSPPLREWFGHDPAHFPEFREKYRRELDGNPEPVGQLATLAKSHNITLLYGAKNPQVNHAEVLAEYLAEHGIRRAHRG